MHITFFSNSFNFLVTCGLSVTIFHSTCIFCVKIVPKMTYNVFSGMLSSTLLLLFCIPYGTVLANTAVLSVCTYRLFAGTWRPWWVLLQHCIIQCCTCACCFSELHKEYLTNKSLGIIPLASVAELAHVETIVYSILNHWLTQLIWCTGNRSLDFGIFSYTFHYCA